METKTLPIEELKAAEYNPRKDLRPGDDEYERLRRSIQEFGYVSPIIINKSNNVVIGGHQRLKVLQELGHKEVLCVLVDMDESHEKLLNLALNKIQGDWDMEKLESLLSDIQQDGFDATLTGFSEEEIDGLIGSFDPLADEVPEPELEEDSADVGTTVVCPKCRHTADKEEFKIN